MADFKKNKAHPQSEHIARKRFGQNFLHDQNIIDKIIRAINPKTEQTIIEIGPGQGALTYPLLKILGQLQAVEIDRDLIDMLNRQSPAFGQLTIHEGDALKFDFSQLYSNTGSQQDTAKPEKLRLVGNLPYNISTPIIFHLLEFIDSIYDMHFMLQKEVVERMAAKDHNKNYGRLSVMLQWYCEVEYLFDIPASAFNPPPKVVSSLVRLHPRSKPLASLKDEQQFARLVNKVFQQRRKTIRNTLKNYLSAEEIQALDISPTARPETLSILDFARLSNAISTEII